ncbi:MAG TPA: MT-A70 family methyltransferase [Xanthobacteraceae bacterium]|nr:MT-A70 family methyltransferase [Xanthobacteraceae bacterium]
MKIIEQSQFVGMTVESQTTSEQSSCKTVLALGRDAMDKTRVGPAQELLQFVAGQRFTTVLADPPWRFTNRTGKMAPEHRRLSRYETLSTDEIAALPIPRIVMEPAHLYLWVPNALLPEGLRVMKAWGFEYKTNIVWHKLRKDGGSDGRGVGFYFRNVSELILFGVRGKNARTLAPGRRQVNYIGTRKREHSRKPDEQYGIIESCSPGPYLELFARGERGGWMSWGAEADVTYRPTWKTYAHNSGTDNECRSCVGTRVLSRTWKNDRTQEIFRSSERS